MQRRSFLSLLLCALLYWAGAALSTHCAYALDTPEQPYLDERIRLTQPHIAVVLPVQSTSFGRYADSVRLGVLAAAAVSQDPLLPVIVYATTEEPARIIDSYQRALSTGARAVIGPLTRNAVSALAISGQVTVPTLALNAPDTEVALPPDLYVFGLQIESEARQVAQLAFKQGGRKSLVVVGETLVGRRIAQAFMDEWRSLKADIANQFVYTTDPSTLTKLGELVNSTLADVVFMSLDAPRARFIRPYLGTRLPIYATSIVYLWNAVRLENYDLEGLRFLDMPWLLQPDHPAVMSYQRPVLQSGALDQERFYALGVDAYRIVQVLLQSPAQMPAIDGVTGTVKLMPGQQFTHDLVPAQFANGSVRMLESILAR
ncbi:MAG: penicillin-binding protein activator [Burkholderiales bacterium]